jgi:hypothetical protein
VVQHLNHEISLLHQIAQLITNRRMVHVLVEVLLRLLWQVTALRQQREVHSHHLLLPHHLDESRMLRKELKSFLLMLATLLILLQLALRLRISAPEALQSTQSARK